MSILLGEKTDVFHVKVIEIDSKPVVKMPNIGMADTAAIVKYVEVAKSEIVAPRPQTQPQPQPQRTIDIIDAEIIETPQGKPKQSTTGKHFGMRTGSTFLEMHRANAQAEQGRQIGVVVGGAFVGVIDAFRNKETTLISKDAQSYTLKGSYEAGKTIGGWAKDRVNDVKKWGEDLFSPSPHPVENTNTNPPINWPDILPPIRDIPFGDFEPNFDIDPDFNFDDYKRRTRIIDPNTNTNNNTNNLPTRPEIPQGQFEDNINDLEPILPIPVEYDIDFPPEYQNGSFTLKLRFVHIGETVVNRAEWYYNYLRAMGSGTSKNTRAVFKSEMLYSFKVNNPKKLRCKIVAPQTLKWHIISSDEDIVLHETAHGWSHTVYQYYGDYQSTNTNRSTAYPTNIEFLPKPQSPENEPPTRRRENEVTTCLFDEEKIKRIIRSLKAKIEIPLVEAEKKNVNGVERWVPKINRTQIEVIAVDENTAASVALIYRKIAEIQIDLIKMRNEEQPIAAIPEWWQIRTGSQRPQLVVLYAEKLSNGKLGRTRWPITIPHYIGRNRNPRLPSYRKGQWEAILTLKDNSKLMINAISREEAERVVNAIKPLIAPSYLVNSQLKIGIRKGEQLKQCLVVPTSARFFATGQKDTQPNWVKSF